MALNKTFLPGDVLVTNTYSKAVLRAAAEHIVASRANVDYFPSYESATLSEHARAFKDDQRHVEDALVRFNVDRMVDAYRPDATPANAADIGAAVAEAREEIAGPQSCRRLANPGTVARSGERQPRFCEPVCRCCFHLGRSVDARAIVANFPAEADDWRVQLLEARAVLAEGSANAALERLTALADQYPKRAVVLRALLDGYVQLGLWSDALSVAHRWSSLAPSAAEPFPPHGCHPQGPRRCCGGGGGVQARARTIGITRR